jgi:uncharacterized membrane protein YccC
MKRQISTLSRLFGEVTPGTFDPGWALFSANSFIAAMLAIYVAFLLGLQRPYWAMLTVYLTAQPLAGAARSKAVFRLVGTVLGAAAAVAFVAFLVNEPVLLSVAITAWAGLCLYVSLHDRTPRSYAFMLAGYTATTVAFSSVAVPEAVFDTALARIEEIALGISCATVVHSLLFPRDVSSVLLKRVGTSVRDAGAWVADALQGTNTKAERIDRQRLASDVTELEMLSTHVPFDTAAARPKLWAIRALQDHLAVLLPVLTAIEDRLAALRAVKSEMPELDDLMKSASDWARDPHGSKQTAASLLSRCEELTVARLTAAGADWPTLLALSATTKLSALIETLARSRRFAAIIHSHSLGADPLLKPDSHRARRALHHDSGLAALSVLALFVAVLSCCAAWILAAWPDGSIAAQMAAIYVALYGSLDDAAPSLASFAVWTAVSLPIAAAYLFLIFPAIDGFPMLVVSLAPAFLAMGYLQASARHGLKALALLIGVIAALDLQNRFSADFASFANLNSAEIVGIVAAFLAMRTCRSVTAATMARRLLRHGWADLAILASGRRPINRDRWLGVMLDRLGLVVPRLALSGSDVEFEASNSLAALQMGLDLIDLRSALDGVENGRRESADNLMAALSRVFRKFASGRTAELGECQRVLSVIDAATRELGLLETATQRQIGLSALVGLRRTLFPDASPFVVSEVCHDGRN